ncbi:MAG: carboxypeptidase regulatory-like domain-containing protein [Terriglobales bacterium]|jgi:plastocyanin
MKHHQAATAVLLFLSAVVLLRFVPATDAAATGEIIGTVKLNGPAPSRKPFDMSKDPGCAQTRSGTAAAENVVVGPGGGLANVVVYISQGLSGTEPASSQPVKLEQKGCQYVPHVVAVNPGQLMSVVNDDKTIHNVHPDPRPGGGNKGWNKSQMAGTPPIDVVWANEEVAIPIKCNIHPWMRGYIVVVKGPHGVSGESGTFKLDGVPAGTYTLTAWHETYGTLTQKVTVVAGKAAAADFTFKAK